MCNPCLELRRVRGGAHICGRTLTVISQAACIACPHRAETAGRHDLALHPHAVHGSGAQDWDAEALLRVAREAR